MKKAKPKGRKTAKAPTRRRPAKSGKGKSRNLEKEPAIKPPRTAVRDLLPQMQSAVAKLRETLATHKAQSIERSKLVQTWLGSAQAKEFLRKDPKLREVFVRARAAAKALPKEHAKVIAAREAALEKMVTQIASFRRAAGAE